MLIKCVLIDDEPLALKILSDYVQRTPFLEVQATFTDPLKAFEYLNEHEADLILVDIQMPDLNGLELVKSLKKSPALIFTTAYDKYAIEGFKVDAIDYLLKPIDYPDFLKAVSKAKEWIQVIQQPTSSVDSDEAFLFIKTGHKFMRIDFNDIQYIQGMSEYVKVHLTSGNPIMSLLSLKALEVRLPETTFMRVHKSYIVNLKKVQMVERHEIFYDDGVVIPVSPQYREKFQEYIQRNFMN